MSNYALKGKNRTNQLKHQSMNESLLFSKADLGIHSLSSHIISLPSKSQILSWMRKRRETIMPRVQNKKLLHFEYMDSSFPIQFYFIKGKYTKKYQKFSWTSISGQQLKAHAITRLQDEVHQMLEASISRSCRHFHRLSSQAHPSLLQLHTRDTSSTLWQI